MQKKLVHDGAADRSLHGHLAGKSPTPSSSSPLSLTVSTSSDDRSMHGPSDTANHHLQCWNETEGSVQSEHYLTLCCALAFTCSAASPASLCSCPMSAPSPCPRSSTLTGRKAILLRYRKSLLAVT
mmetsp:Transcript_34344/g.107671  ORF Transcript_34344/g.107671 Transcript_34344/m.107671 type:complete len:126 (+) Transcript_34344:150-527(+)